MINSIVPPVLLIYTTRMNVQFIRVVCVYLVSFLWLTICFINFDHVIRQTRFIVAGMQDEKRRTE